MIEEIKAWLGTILWHIDVTNISNFITFYILDFQRFRYSNWPSGHMTRPLCIYTHNDRLRVGRLQVLAPDLSEEHHQQATRSHYILGRPLAASPFTSSLPSFNLYILSKCFRLLTLDNAYILLSNTVKYPYILTNKLNIK